jgi:translation initiation factor 1
MPRRRARPHRPDGRARAGVNIVYRSDVGRICPGCQRPLAQCACKDTRGKPAGGKPTGQRTGAVRVGRATQGRGGRVVSVITGLPLGDGELAALAAELRKRCGSGGTVRDGTIEIQGEHRDTLVAELVRRGYQARRSGG